MCPLGGRPVHGERHEVASVGVEVWHCRRRSRCRCDEHSVAGGYHARRGETHVTRSSALASFEALIAEADATPFEGWDFSHLDGRVAEAAPGWNLDERIRAKLAPPLLDMGTGGGEFLSSFAPFTGLTIATESWRPNVPIATRRLHRLGAHVVQIEAAPDNDAWNGRGGDLPFRDTCFGLVMNRHESFSPTEVFRVLRRSGTFITQQVGARNDRELHNRFGNVTSRPHEVDLAAQIASTGLDVIESRDEYRRKEFRDVGAVAYYMKAIAWEFPGFSIGACRELLAGIHADIEKSGPLIVHDHRVLVEARKP